MNNRKWFVAVLSIVVLSLVMAACAGGAAPAEEEEEAPAEEEPAEEEEMAEEEMEEAMEIGLGMATVTSGDPAFIGQEQLDFVQVAVDIFNEETGMNVVVVHGDTEINPDTGKIVAERMVADDSIYAVIGPAGSQVCEAVQPTFEEAGLAHISPSCTAVILTDPGTDTFFRPIPHDGLQGPTDANYMIDVIGAESAWLLDDTSSYAVGLADQVESVLLDAGVTVERAQVNPDDTDLSSVATTIMASPADVVFFPSQSPPQIGTLAVQLREQGFEGAYMLADGGFNPEVVNAGQDAVEGAFVSFFGPGFTDGNEQYADRYLAEYGDEFGGFGPTAAMAATIALEAIGRCVDAENLSRECVRDEIAATDMSADDNILGVPVTFGEGNQNAAGGFDIYEIQGGEFVLIQD